MNNQKILCISLLCLLMYVVYNCYKSSSSGNKSGEFTVYGTSWCGYTTKQRDALGDRHVYVDCDLDKDRCEGITSFPETVNNATGEKHKGFNPNL